jgi:hypothetical protein
MASDQPDDAAKAFSFLVADALEALIPLVDGWAQDVESQLHGHHSRAYADGYAAGVRRLAAEVKDQLVERVLRLRE